jgi:hypothetical protein
MKASESINKRDWSWTFWTVFGEIVKDSIWTFDQLQGILYTVVPIRMTIIKQATSRWSFG